MLHLLPIVSLDPPRKGEGRAGTRRKITGDESLPKSKSQPHHLPSSTVPSIPGLLITVQLTSIEPLEGDPLQARLDINY